MDEYDIAKLYQEMELELIASLKRNLLRHELKEIEENMEYPQWQALKLRDIQRIKRENQDIIGKYTSNISKYVKKIIKEEYKQGKKEAISLFNDANRGKRRLNESFFKTNNKKVKAMIDEINGTFKEAEKAIFRMSNDVYQKTIFKAGFYLSHGTVNLKQAINTAMRDFAKRGINCIEYKDGRRINIADYARMAVRTASQRARLMAEGDFRKRLKRTLVKITKHGTSCKYCKVYEQQILVDDVYSGGVPDGKHELLSSAMSKGLFHPNCRHKAPTYYEELDELKYEQMAKSATAKEEEERKKDLFSQKEQRKRREEVWKEDKIEITEKDFDKFKNKKFNEDLPKIIKRINKSNLNVKRLYKNHFKDLNEIEYSEERSLYNPYYNIIKYKKGTDMEFIYGIDIYRTIFHEMGHFFDNYKYFDFLNYKEIDIMNKQIESHEKFDNTFWKGPSCSDFFLQALRKDKEILKNKINDDFITKIIADMSTMPTQDILDGMYGLFSEGKIRAGHGNEYYDYYFNSFKKYNMIDLIQEGNTKLGYNKDEETLKEQLRSYMGAKEAWAHMFSAYVCNDYTLPHIKKHFPNTYEAFEYIINKGVTR